MQQNPSNLLIINEYKECHRRETGSHGARKEEKRWNMEKKTYLCKTTILTRYERNAFNTTYFRHTGTQHRLLLLHAFVQTR